MTTVVARFNDELESFGEYTFNGKIGQEYQPFVDYWVETVCRNLSNPITERDRPLQNHPLIQQFFDEQLVIGVYILDTQIGRSYQSLIDLWEVTSRNLGRKL